MKATFVTAGTVDPVYDDDGKIRYYNVGRKDMGTICLTYLLEEYYTAGIHVIIDGWGSPWIKK